MCIQIGVWGRFLQKAISSQLNCDRSFSQLFVILVKKLSRYQQLHTAGRFFVVLEGNFHKL